jgi:nucleoside-diphosphate-sugar epimerase
MKIVVTGSTGRVGANLVKRLCDDGHDITACLMLNDKHEFKLDGMKIRKAYIDILDAAGMAEVIKDSDIVIHTAAVHESSLLKIPNYKFFNINVKGVFNVLEGIRYSGKHTHLICLSSSAVYDVFTSPRSPIAENQDRKPITLYGMTKILVEEQVRQYEWQYGIPSTILRPNYIVAGPEMLYAFNYSVVFDVLQRYADNSKVQFHTPHDPNAWMAVKSSSEIKSGNLCIPTSPEGESWQWHMVDVRDVIDLIEKCMENEDAYGKTFNVAGADVCDWSKVVPYIAEKTEHKIVRVEIPNLWQYSFDQSASKDILGFESKHDHFAMVNAAVAMSNNEDVGIIQGETLPYA